MRVAGETGTGKEFIAEICKSLGFGKEYNKNWEHLLLKLFELKPEPNGQIEIQFVKLVDVIVEVGIMAPAATSTYGNIDLLSHSICHLYEHLNTGSILDNPAFFSTANKLAHWVSEKVIMDKDAKGHNLLRIIHPMAVRVVDASDPARLDDSLPLSLCLSPEKKLELFSRLNIISWEKNLQVFTESGTLREYVVRMVKEKLRFESRDGKKILLILDAIRDDLPAGIFEQYVNDVMRINDQPAITFDDLKANAEIAESAVEVESGIFVDVDDTLIVDGDLNHSLVRHLEKAFKKGKKIIIFTGGSPEVLTEQLRKLGCPEYFLPVVGKVLFVGKILENLVDDTLPEYQGFRAKKYFDPGDVRGLLSE